MLHRSYQSCLVFSNVAMIWQPWIGSQRSLIYIQLEMCCEAFGEIGPAIGHLILHMSRQQIRAFSMRFLMPDV